MAGHSVTVDPTGDHRSSEHDGAHLEVEAADLRVEAEVEARRRERWMRDRLRSDATIVGALTAAGDADVTVHLANGARLTGQVAAVGHDIAGIRSPGLHAAGGVTWVAVAAITALETAGPLPSAGPGARSTSLDVVLNDLVETRAEVVLESAGPTSVTGTLVAAGEVATVQSGPGGRTVYVTVSEIVTIREAG